MLQPALRARLAALGLLEPQAEQAPQRILLVDDMVSEGGTACLTMGLLWGAYPHAEIRLLAGMGDAWRERLGRAWVEAHHSGMLAKLDATYTEWGEPWRYLVAGLVDDDNDPLGWQPLGAGHRVIQGLVRYLPAAAWLAFPAWVQAQLAVELAQRLAAAQLTGEQLAAACVRLLAPVQVEWTAQRRAYSEEWREKMRGSGGSGRRSRIGAVCGMIRDMDAPTLYEPFAAAFVRGRAIQGGSQLGTDAAELPLHYFKRVPLLPRIQWALGVLHSLQPTNLLDIGSGRGKFLWPLLDAFPDAAGHGGGQRIRDACATWRRCTWAAIERLTVRQADATSLPFADGAFDVVTHAGGAGAYPSRRAGTSRGGARGTPSMC